MGGESFEVGEPMQGRFTGYALAGYPDSRDDVLDTYISEIRAAGPRGVANAIAVASEKGRRVLLSYAERAATRAVRSRDREVLERGLIAMVVGGLDENTLEALLRMPLLEDACIRLDLEPAEVFETIADVVGHHGNVNLMIWLSRASEDRTLKCMGFEALGSGPHFRYRWAG
jgi:hypothetical protein